MSDENNKIKTEEELPPTLTQMESAKSAMITFAMYHFQALRSEGYDMSTAKQIVADTILDLYNQYCKSASLDSQIKINDPSSPLNSLNLLEDIINDVKALGVSAKPIYNKLIDFKKLVLREN